MAVAKDRMIAWFFAIIFIISTLALTFTVVYSVLQDNNQQANNGATSTPADGTNPQENAVNSENQLQGKPLAGFTPVASIAELQKIDTTPGTGETVQAGDTISADYTGAVAATGVVFQSSLDSGNPVTFGLDQVIAGWSQGVPDMKVGGTRRLLIPANLAYGANPPQGSGIPANADLVFDITLRAIVE